MFDREWVSLDFCSRFNGRSLSQNNRTLPILPIVRADLQLLIPWKEKVISKKGKSEIVVFIVSANGRSFA